MLSPSRDDEDDDSHLCIKCNSTIIGLENYVKHRKDRCGKKFESEMKTTNPFDLTYSLGADFFFQSLELQSSVKKPSLSRLTPPITSLKQNQLAEAKQSQVTALTREISTMSPLESTLRGEDWIGGHSLRIGTSDDNQTKLINAVASISGVSKKELPSTSYNLGPYDYKGDDESDCASDDTEDEDDEEPHASGGKWKPSPQHTGGKWQPSPHHSGGKWRPATPDDDDEDEDQEHTGGKWKPIMPDLERDDDYDAPPPGHTRGKWIPGAQEHKTQIMQTTIQTKTSVQYWCGPCNRRLASKPIYEKHLLSNLHMKKVLPEHDLEYSGLIKQPSFHEKRDVKPSQYLNDHVYDIYRKPRARESDNIAGNYKQKRNRKPLFTYCTGCRSKVRVSLMGKHLISHFHLRKATGAYGQLVLDNIDAIIRQSPFQCSPCKFYTNWQENFMAHWLSKDHEDRVNGLEGMFWCSFCKYECETSHDMHLHMTEDDHNEVVAVINRSMPIIIRKKTIFKCEECPKQFRFNVEAKRHSDKVGHKLLYSASDSYQEFHRCHCGKKFKGSLTLAGHLKTKHKQKAYFCMVCAKSFSTSKEAKHHRQSSQHRVKKKEKLKERGVAIKDLSRKCPYCVNVVMENVLELKNHIETVHPDLKKSCPKCGMTFALSQEVTSHIRTNACQIQPPDQSLFLSLWKCSQCAFTTDSHAECYYHEVLHTTPIIKHVNKNGRVRKVEIYDCPGCPKAFSKHSLRHHLRQHTLERPFVCTVCNANFIRQGSLSNHMKKMHEDFGLEMESEGVIEERICQKCGKHFENETLLTDHTSKGCPSTLTKNDTQRKFKCTHENCTYLAATTTQLARHRRSHGQIGKFHECNLCPYKTNASSQMKRHKRCHEGTKPYLCPHCPFTCASLENLRKHVSRSHPSQFLYICRDCPVFQTNMARELRGHLVSYHAELYDSGSANEAVKCHLMKRS